MARPFSATNAKRIIERHQNIIEKLNNAASAVEKYRTKVKEASGALVAQHHRGQCNLCDGQVLAVCPPCPADSEERLAAAREYAKQHGFQVLRTERESA